jgi:hypothetical protein
MIKSSCNSSYESNSSGALIELEIFSSKHIQFGPAILQGKRAICIEIANLKTFGPMILKTQFC